MWIGSSGSDSNVGLTRTAPPEPLRRKRAYVPACATATTTESFASTSRTYFPMPTGPVTAPVRTFATRTPRLPAPMNARSPRQTMPVGAWLGTGISLTN